MGSVDRTASRYAFIDPQNESFPSENVADSYQQVAFTVGLNEKINSGGHRNGGGIIGPLINNLTGWPGGYVFCARRSVQQGRRFSLHLAKSPNQTAVRHSRLQQDAKSPSPWLHDYCDRSVRGGRIRRILAKVLAVTFREMLPAVLCTRCFRTAVNPFSSTSGLAATLPLPRAGAPIPSLPRQPLTVEGVALGARLFTKLLTR
jgi:hypothetical protein